MSRAPLLLLLGLLLNVQQDSSAPIPEGLQSSAVEGPVQPEPDERNIPAEAVPPPDETPGEIALPVTEEDPEPVTLSRPPAAAEALAGASQEPLQRKFSDAAEEASQGLHIGTDSADSGSVVLPAEPETEPTDPMRPDGETTPAETLLSDLPEEVETSEVLFEKSTLLTENKPEEQLLVLVPAEPESGETDLMGPDGEVPTEASQEASKESSQELPNEEKRVEDTEETPATKLEPEPFMHIPVEPQSEKVNNLEPDGEEPTPDEAGQEKIVSVVPGGSAEQALPSEDEEKESVSSSEELETSQERPKEETHIPALIEETLTSKPGEEEEPFFFVPVEPETEETKLIGPDGEEATAQESTHKISSDTEKLEAIAVSGSEGEEEHPEEPAKEEEASVTSAVEEEHAANDKRILATTEEENFVLPPAEPETQSEPKTSDETSQEDPGIIVPVDPSEPGGRETPSNTKEEDPRLLLTSDEGSEGASEMATGPLTVLVPYANERSAPEDSHLKPPVEPEENNVAEDRPEDGEKAAEIIPAAAEAKSAPSKASGSSARDEPVAPVSRGAILGAALFTLMSFIITGFVGITLSGKLRGKK